MMVGYEDGIWLVRWRDGGKCREARLWKDGVWRGCSMEHGRFVLLDSSDAAYIAWKNGITRVFEYDKKRERSSICCEETCA